MHCYHLPVTQHVGEDGITLTARTPGGRIFASAGGPTREDAEDRLKLFINETLAGRVEDGLDPFSMLRLGEPSKGDLTLTEKDLFPIVLRKLRRESGLTQVEMAKRMDQTQSAYSKLEQFGINPSLATIHKVQEALGRPILHYDVA
jgi:DNA-binding XRE family transcriptional regulator